MTYRLRPGLSFCHAEGRTIFLDVQADRYFELGPRLAAILDKVMAGKRPGAVDALVDQGLITSVSTDAPPILPFTWPPPEDSRLEAALAVKPRPQDVVLVGMALGLAATRLRRHGFSRTLDHLARRRPRLEEQPGDPTIAALADRYLAARRLMPVQPVCLRDSLALLEFLALHRRAADLVIGIEAAPFSAHCWVQSGPCVLNETVHQARRHTPILAA
jgi:hypothetical protein